MKPDASISVMKKDREDFHRLHSKLEVKMSKRLTQPEAFSVMLSYTKKYLEGDKK
jgi:hypothetical protein